MGLCKCPKRKTTSHFCFHHCVNVCEHCIVNNHTTCVVKSYTTWLKEASGSISSSSVSTSALCGVCQKQFVLTPKEFENLTTDFNDSSLGAKTAIRLLCYHVVHARCLSIYVKKQIKEQKILKCPSCAQPLWLQKQLQDSNDTTEIDCNELSPVALQLYKHLLDHGTWWGHALITNQNVNDIEKYLLEDDEDPLLDEKSKQLFESKSTLEMNSVSDNTSPLTLVQTIQSPNSNNSYYNYNNSELVHTPSNLTTINHRSNTAHQTNQPVHHRIFNNNYGIESTTQQQCLSVNLTIVQSSDLNSRHTIQHISSTPLLLNNVNNLNHDEQQDPSGKNRPKKFNNQFWSFSYQRILQYFCGVNNSTTRVAILIILCILIIVILLVAITSFTRSNNEIFDNNSIDYGGD